MRLLGRLMLWPLLLAICVLVLLPFTESGSRWLLAQLDRLEPLTLEYAGGTLAGDIVLKRLVWSDGSIHLELDDISARLDRACLWRSAVCLDALQAASLDIEILSGNGEEQPSGEQSADEELVVFPLVIEVPHLELAALSVRWQDGAWQQGRLSGSVTLSESTIAVGRTSVANARLELRSGTADAAAPLELPGIDLPLDLQVEELSLQGVAWDSYGSQGTLQSLSLSGGWRNSALQLQRLQLRSLELGELVASGELDFTGQWPLEFRLDAFAAELEGWPGLLDRHIVLDLAGTVPALELALSIDGAAQLTGRGSIDPLDPTLPFRLAAELQWAGQLPLSEQVALPPQLAGITLQAPLVLAASGTLQEQGFQLDATGSAPAYDSLSLSLGGSHENGLLVLDDMRLRDATAAADLWGRGELRYGEELQWSLELESTGLALPPMDGGFAGQIEGGLKLSGWLANEEWELAVADVDLRGRVNDLPASISGYAGLGSDLGLRASQLEASLNDARMSLRSAPGGADPGHFELAVDDLARWLPDSSGRLSMSAVLARDWQGVQLEGSLEGFQWEGLEISKGGLEGSYDAGSTAFRLGVNLAKVEFGALELGPVGLVASGNESAQEITLRSSGDIDGALEMSGALDQAGEWHGQLAATSLQTSEGTWHLGQAVALHFKPDTVSLQLSAHCWHYQRSRLCPGDILLGEEGSASLEVVAGLDALSAFLPAYIAAKGQLDARLSAQWQPGTRTTVEGELRGQDLQIIRHFGSGEFGTASWQSLNVDIANGDTGLDLTAALRAEDIDSVVLALRLPTDRSQELDGKLTLAQVQLSALAPFIPTLSALAGELNGSIGLGGTLDRPLAQGNLALTDGRLAVLGNPTELADLTLDLVAEGDSFRVQGRGMLGGGALDIEGSLVARPDWQLELMLTGDKHELLLPPYTQMQVSERLKLSYGRELLEVTGTINIHKGTLEHEQLPEGSVGLSNDVVEVDINGNVVSEDRALPIRMNIAVLLEDRFMVVGDMVNATLGGDLQLVQEPGKPLQLFGNLNVIGGELRAYQQHLRIKRGTISFSGPPENPELEVRAQREISTEQVVVGIELLGTLEQPRLEIFSEPAMSQANTMSYLIRGRSVDTGASADGAAMALSLGTGVVNQSELVAELNRIPGISNLAFGAEGTADDTAATVGGYIGERLYLSYGLGIYEPINVLTARLYLQTRLWLEVVSRLENSVDLYYSFDIN